MFEIEGVCVPGALDAAIPVMLRVIRLAKGPDANLINMAHAVAEVAPLGLDPAKVVAPDGSALVLFESHLSLNWG